MATKGKPGTLAITLRLREHQETDPTFGPLFAALHTFADRTMAEFFYDAPKMPYPVLAMEKDRRTRRGFYTAQDGYTLIHRINLNPFSLKTGADAAQTLAHELVHLWQNHVGRPCRKNYHNEEFHARMAQYGILTEGPRGVFVKYIDATWDAWMIENEDLQLDKFLLPGIDPKPKRELLKHQCPECQVSVRHRNELNLICGDCMIPFEVV